MMRIVPRYKINALTSPNRTVDDRLMREVAVSVFKTFSSSR